MDQGHQNREARYPVWWTNFRDHGIEASWWERQAWLDEQRERRWRAEALFEEGRGTQREVNLASGRVQLAEALEEYYYEIIEDRMNNEAAKRAAEVRRARRAARRNRHGLYIAPNHPSSDGEYYRRLYAGSEPPPSLISQQSDAEAPLPRHPSLIPDLPEPEAFVPEEPQRNDFLPGPLDPHDQDLSRSLLLPHSREEVLHPPEDELEPVPADEAALEATEYEAGHASSSACASGGGGNKNTSYDLTDDDWLDEPSDYQPQMLNGYWTDQEDEHHPDPLDDPAVSDEPAACSACFAPLPLAQVMWSQCSHTFCEECLTHLISTSMEREALFPPACRVDGCNTLIPIHLSDYTDRPTSHLERWIAHNRSLVDANLLVRYEQHRVICDVPVDERLWCAHCGTFQRITTQNRTNIIPVHIRNPDGTVETVGSEIVGETVLCSECNERTCRVCQKAAHNAGAFCTPITEEEEQDIQALLQSEAAKELGLKACFACKRVIEKSAGCNHMTCVCSANFCYLCGKPWRTCSCPQFDEPNGGAELEGEETDEDNDDGDREDRDNDEGGGDQVPRGSGWAENNLWRQRQQQPNLALAAPVNPDPVNWNHEEEEQNEVDWQEEEQRNHWVGPPEEDDQQAPRWVEDNPEWQQRQQCPHSNLRHARLRRPHQCASCLRHMRLFLLRCPDCDENLCRRCVQQDRQNAGANEARRSRFG